MMNRSNSTTRVESREIRAGAGDALAKVFELIATPAIFGFGGWLLDERLGTFPLMTLVLGVTVLAYQGWSFARAYSKSLDEALESRRAGYSAGTHSAVDDHSADSADPASADDIDAVVSAASTGDADAVVSAASNVGGHDRD